MVAHALQISEELAEEEGFAVNSALRLLDAMRARLQPSSVVEGLECTQQRLRTSSKKLFVCLMAVQWIGARFIKWCMDLRRIVHSLDSLV